MPVLSTSVIRANVVLSLNPVPVNVTLVPPAFVVVIMLLASDAPAVGVEYVILLDIVVPVIHDVEVLSICTILIKYFELALAVNVTWYEKSEEIPDIPEQSAAYLQNSESLLI